MQILHRRGGKFVLEFEPLELQVLHAYRHALNNSAVQKPEELLGAMFQQQVDFMVDSLKGIEPMGVEKIRSKMPVDTGN